MLATLAAYVVALQSAPDLTKPITYTANALPAKQVMQDISRLTGTHFAVFDDAIEDHYILRFDNVPLKDALDKIAYISFGKWNYGQSGFELRRDTKAVRENQEEELKKEYNDYVKALTRMRKQLDKHPNFDTETAKTMAQDANKFRKQLASSGRNNPNWWRQRSTMENSLPIGRAMTRIALTMKPEYYVSVGDKIPVVFSNEPNSIERQLPDEILNIIDQLVNEQAIWAEAAAQYTAAQASEYENFDQIGFSKKISGVKKVLLKLSKYGRGSGVNMELILADAKGRTMTRGNTYLSPYGFDDGENPAPKTEQPTRKPYPPIELSAQAAQASRLFGYNSMGRADEVKSNSDAATGDLLKKFLNPTKFEPLGLVYGDGLLSVAATQHRNLAALADDSMLNLKDSYVVNGKFNQEALLGPDDYLPVKTSMSETGWIAQRPKSLGEYDDEHINRETLETLVKTAYQTGRVPLDVQADFAFSSPGQQASQICSAYCTAVIGQAGRLLTQNDWNSLRFYGSLSEEERRDPAKQSIARLNPNQIGILNEIIFSNWAQLDFEANDQSSDASDGGPWGWWDRIDRQPVEALPDGIPMNSFFTISAENKSAIVTEMQYSEWYQGFQVQEPESISWMVYQSNHPTAGDSWKILSLQGANKNEVTIKLSLKKSASRTLLLTECKLIGKRGLTSKDLPDDLRTKLDKLVADLEEQYKKYGNQVEVSNGGEENGQP